MLDVSMAPRCLVVVLKRQHHAPIQLTALQTKTAKCINWKQFQSLMSSSLPGLISFIFFLFLQQSPVIYTITLLIQVPNYKISRYDVFHTDTNLKKGKIIKIFSRFSFPFIDSVTLKFISNDKEMYTSNYKLVVVSICIVYRYTHMHNTGLDKVNNKRVNKSVRERNISKILTSIKVSIPFFLYSFKMIYSHKVLIRKILINVVL